MKLGSPRFTITFAHFRYGTRCGHLKVYHRSQTKWEPEAKGGLTICSIRDEETGFAYLGAAICSREDDFCYRIGRAIAQNRAADQMSESVWAEFNAWKESGAPVASTDTVYIDASDYNDIPSAITSQEPLGA
jgi:hypothetical protein